ncbi:hypothetical protein BD779DRAFT_1671611 [Infundibulicybe gibba]|nr:hypothetical protein BD779DRAFT_1671611 [Infundibulicybe gibba]
MAFHEEDALLEQEGIKEGLSYPTKLPSSRWERPILQLITLLLFLNLLVAAANSYYSRRVTEAMATCQQKDISDLPRPDPFVGLKRSRGEGTDSDN